MQLHLACGDVAVVVRVLELRGANALVALGADSEEIAVELVAPVQVGEELLCHAGVAIGRVAP